MNSNEIIYNKNKNWFIVEIIEKCDFLWTRLDVICYVVQVTNNPIELFNMALSLDVQENDSVIQLKNTNCTGCGTEE